ncbi:hypothetical protein PO124_29050 [Bacillus licheniformis]|nr:hypothetical protein [Bacillus licheniformis]
MKKLVKVRGITLGEGRPKSVCRLSEKPCPIKRRSGLFQTLDADIAEWRADFMKM